MPRIKFYIGNNYSFAKAVFAENFSEFISKAEQKIQFVPDRYVVRNEDEGVEIRDQEGFASFLSKYPKLELVVLQKHEEFERRASLPLIIPTETPSVLPSEEVKTEERLGETVNREKEAKDKPADRPTDYYEDTQKSVRDVFNATQAHLETVKLDVQARVDEIDQQLRKEEKLREESLSFINSKKKEINEDLAKAREQRRKIAEELGEDFSSLNSDEDRAAFQKTKDYLYDKSDYLKNSEAIKREREQNIQDARKKFNEAMANILKNIGSKDTATKEKQFEASVQLQKSIHTLEFVSKKLDEEEDLINDAFLDSLVAMNNLHKKETDRLQEEKTKVQKKRREIQERFDKMQLERNLLNERLREFPPLN